MNADRFITTLNFYPNRNPKLRFFALWYFCALITVWTVAGHTILGFEQAYATPIVAVLTGCLMQLLLEFVDAKARGRSPRFSGGIVNFINQLPAAIIPALACAMLVYPNMRLEPIIFATALSIASKVIFRAPVGDGMTQHIFNPSNFGITATLLLFPSVGLAPPYMFTENVTGMWNWIIPGIILVAGVIVHGKFTGRFPLVAGWLVGFLLQGMIRAAYFGIPFIVPLIPMTSAGFSLFTLFMIPDPATTPIEPKRQVAFGLGVATIYGVLFVSHVVFGMFIALATASLTRGVALYIQTGWQARKVSEPEARMPGRISMAAGAD